MDSKHLVYCYHTHVHNFLVDFGATDSVVVKMSKTVEGSHDAEGFIFVQLPVQQR